MPPVTLDDLPTAATREISERAEWFSELPEQHTILSLIEVRLRLANVRAPIEMRVDRTFGRIVNTTHLVGARHQQRNMRDQ